jgi:hypothetical protein
LRPGSPDNSKVRDGKIVNLIDCSEKRIKPVL